MKFFKKKKEKVEPENITWPKYVENLDEKKFYDFLEKYPLCFIDFWAPWCAPCKKMTPRMRRISKMYQGKVAFGKVNTQKEKSLAEKYKIMSIPTFMLFKNGKEKATLTGVNSVGEIKKILEKKSIKKFKN